MKFGFSIKHVLTFTLLLTAFNGFTQQSIIDANLVTEFNNGLKLYNNKAYAAAQKKFDKVTKNYKPNTSIKTDASYYNAMCAVKLNQTDADEKVLSFVEENPTSNKKNKAFFNVGNYYFANKKGRELALFFASEMAKNMGYRNRGAKALVNKNDRGFWAVYFPKPTALILEPFFGTNKADVARFNEPAYVGVILNTIHYYKSLNL